MAGSFGTGGSEKLGTVGSLVFVGRSVRETFGDCGCAETVPSIDCKLMLGTALGFATLRLVLFRCASANGIAQTARSESRMSALQSRCALIEEFCFFIVLSLSSFGRIHGSNPLCVQVCVHRGEHACSEKHERASRFFLHFFSRKIARPQDRGALPPVCAKAARQHGKIRRRGCFRRGNVRFPNGN